MKRLFSVLMSILVATAFCMNVYAESDFDSESYTAHFYGVDIPDSGEPETLGVSRALAECQGGPHDMLAHGWGSIYNVDTGTTVVSSGCCAQCTKCYLVIVTQGEPGTGSALGYYTTWQPHEALSSMVTVIRQSSNNIQYTSSATIPGIRFRYA